MVNLKTSEDGTSDSQAVTSVQEETTRFLAGVNPEHRYVKPEIDKPMSISHNRQLDVLTQKSLALANDPAFRTAMMRRVAGNLGKLRSIPGRIKTAFGTDYKKRAISDERAMKSLKKEAAFREAAARAEYEDAAKARHEGILENPDLAKLKSNPVHEWLSIQGDPLYGRLMSPSLLGNCFCGGGR